MSELSELIKINRNIERQNEEIIRLLKVIANEDEVEDDFVEEIEDEVEEEVDSIEFVNEIGCVHFIDGVDIFNITIKNNEKTINNLTGECETTNFDLAEFVANESIKRNQMLPDATVILDEENSQNLPEKLKICVERGAERAFLPLYSMSQLVGAPPLLMTVLKVDYYRSPEELAEKLFK
ncbi:hypothetical protein [Methanobrevibacter sp.]|uniref:hypothetical protein n=1 Tax=Methanobrevibacter sp. TaxID=66852 RepID=UPI00388E04C9